MFLAHLIISLSRPWNCPSFKWALISFSGRQHFGNQDLSTSLIIATAVSWILGPVGGKS